VRKFSTKFEKDISFNVPTAMLLHVPFYSAFLEIRGAFSTDKYPFDKNSAFQRIYSDEILRNCLNKGQLWRSIADIQ
jgi:hypothetical protein